MAEDESALSELSELLTGTDASLSTSLSEILASALQELIEVELIGRIGAGGSWQDLSPEGCGGRVRREARLTSTMNGNPTMSAPGSAIAHPPAATAAIRALLRYRHATAPVPSHHHVPGGSPFVPSTRTATIDETARLDAVRRYDILDTPPDGAFDRITQLAARFCQVPISTITIVDTDRIWFKSARGVDVDEIAREPGLCASAVMQLEPYVVSDARIDPRTLDNSLVCGDLGLRFYAAVPLTTSSGHNLGTLNVIDVEPRDISEDELATLHDLGRVVMDELELRLAARERVAAEAMRQAAALRDAVVAGISHEMRTPLGVLHGLMSLQEADDLTTEEIESLRTKQRRHLGHLSRLVQRFLDYASLEGDRPPTMDVATVELVPVVEEAVDLFDEHTVTLDVGSRVPAVRADAVRTGQIVQELVTNATRFGAGRPVEVKLQADDGTVRLSVSDHGRGIHPDDVERVFEKAFRGRDSTGTGLGLYVAKIFAEEQGGHIEVESTLGAGSTFTLVLPMAMPQA